MTVGKTTRDKAAEIRSERGECRYPALDEAGSPELDGHFYRRRK
jgi:hypothetical protein